MCVRVCMYVCVDLAFLLGTLLINGASKQALISHQECDMCIFVCVPMCISVQLRRTSANV